MATPIPLAPCESGALSSETKGETMKTDTHGNGNGLNDLYILPDNPA